MISCQHKSADDWDCDTLGDETPPAAVCQCCLGNCISMPDERLQAPGILSYRYHRFENSA